MTRRMKWLAILAVALVGAMGFVACNGDGGTITSPSIASSSPQAFGIAGTASSQRDSNGNEPDEPDEPDDPNDNVDPNDDPSDDESSDDPSDESSDDESSDKSSDGSGDESGAGTVRGLFFGEGICPESAADCQLAIMIKQTLVIITSETRIDNQPASAEGLSPMDLQLLLVPGLPMRARGTMTADGDLVASQVRIDDEIRASGVVVMDAPGCDVSLMVKDMISLCFTRSGALADPPIGANARIEGIVPMNFMDPYVATRIEIEN